MPIQTAYTHQTLPPWFAEQQQRLGEEAEKLRNLKYEPYPNARIAPFLNPDLERAHQLGRESGDVNEYLRKASRLTEEGADKEFDADQARKYMSPYQQAVLDKLIANSGKAFREQYLPAMRREFIGTGNYGSLQHNQQAERLQAEHQRQLNDTIARSLNDEYSRAGKMFESAQARKLEAAPQFTDQGLLKQGSRIADIAALKEQGVEQRAHEQAKMDLAHQDFLRQKAYPFEAASHQASILSGMPQAPSQYSINQTPGAPQLNTLGQLGALAGNIYGARQAYGRKSGGSVNTKKPKVKPRGLSRLSLQEGTMARKPKPGGSKGVKHLKNQDKYMGGAR